MTGPKQILRRGESCIYAIPIPCVRMRVLSAKCQRVLCQHSSTALFFPPGFTGGFRVESSRAGHMAIDGRIGNAQLYKYFINAKIPSVVHVP